MHSSFTQRQGTGIARFGEVVSAGTREGGAKKTNLQWSPLFRLGVSVLTISHPPPAGRQRGSFPTRSIHPSIRRLGVVLVPAARCIDSGILIFSRRPARSASSVFGSP